ncbi:MAG: hypothetical protein ACFCUJ_16770 [Thiotrichales bacterium]
MDKRHTRGSNGFESKWDLDDPPLHATLSLSGLDENRFAVLRLIERARSEIMILSHNLDPRLFDDPEIIAATRAFLLERSRTLWILVRSARDLIHRNHRLVELVRRWPDRAWIQQLAHRDQPTAWACVIIDNNAVLFLPRSGRYDARLTLDNPQAAQRLRLRFIELRQRAEVMQELRDLRL